MAHWTIAKILVLAGLLAAQASAEPLKKPVRSIAELPRFSYPYTGSVASLLEDAELLLPFVDKVDLDVHNVLAHYDIDDRSTLRRLHETLLDVAEFRRDAAAVNKEAVIVRELADKPLQRATAGDVALAITKAAVSTNPTSPAFAAAFEHAYAGSINRLPWPLYGERAKQNAGQFALLSRAIMIGGEAPLFQPQVDTGGALDETAMREIIGIAVTLRDWLPLKRQLMAANAAYIIANERPKTDIWSARDLVLTKEAKLSTVTVAVWDSGLDTSVFLGQLWTNPRELANGRDDDGNGYVDDVNGIAADADGRREAGLTIPVPASVKTRLDEVIDLEIGMRDQQANDPTPSASRLIAFVDNADAKRMASFWDDDDFFKAYYHGTHIGGIIARGNPAVRLMVVRHTFDWHTPPRRPTLETATRLAQSYMEQVAYMKAGGVRLANMSWTVDIKTEYEDQLAANGVPENERASEAARLFAIESAGLKSAIASAPEILFICAAGNSNNSATFQGSVPASFDMPNVLAVAAVDQDGTPTSFTTTGPTVKIAANGYRVDSLVPGGRHMRASGTSMASPNVVNVAAKLLALDPRLSSARLRALLLDNATPTSVKGFTLLDGRAAAAALGGSPR